MSDAILYQILRARAGEVSGVANLSPRTKFIVRPVFDFPHKEEGEFGPDEFSTFVTMLARSWGTAVPLYLELSRFDPDRTADSGTPLVTHLFDMARQAHLKAIPVAGPLIERNGMTGAYLKGVADIARKDDRGAAIRIPFHDLITPEDLPTILDDVQRAIGLNDSRCDVFLDAGPTDALPGGQATAHTVLRDALLLAAKALCHRKFRALIFCSSSIPKRTTRQGVAASTKVSNVEFQIWWDLARRKTFRRIRFGDYGPRFANQTDKPPKARAPARIHLTTARAHTMYVGPGHSYRKLAEKVITTKDFSKQHGTWGKHAVRDAALGSRNVGNATDWVARDVHMHIETLARAVESRMREAVATLPEALREDLPYGQRDLWSS